MDVPGPVRDVLARRLSKRYPVRVRELEAIIARTGTLKPVDFWPHMSVIAVWTAGSVGAYLPRFASITASGRCFATTGFMRARDA